MSIIRFPYRNRNGDIGISKTVCSRQLYISRGQFFSMPRRDKIRTHVVPINKDSLASLVEKTFQKRRSSLRFPKRPSGFHDNRPPVVKILDSRNCFVTIPSTPLSPPKKDKFMATRGTNEFNSPCECGYNKRGNSGESCYKLRGSPVATIAYDWSTRGTTFSPFFLFRFSFLFSSSFRWHFRRYTYIPFVAVIFRARVVMFLLYITGEVQVRTRMKTKFARSHRDRPENWTVLTP